MFDIKFQQDLLNYLINNPEALPLVNGIKIKALLDDKIILPIYKAIDKYYTKCKTVPTQEELQRAINKINTEDIVKTRLNRTVSSIYEATASTITYEQFKEFIVVKQAEELSATLAQKQTLDKLLKIKDTIAGIENFCMADVDMGIDPFEASIIEKRADFYEEIHGGIALPTGLSHLDQLIRGGGIRPVDFVTIMGTTGGGKTALSVNIAMNMVRQGAFVVYYVLDNAIGEIMERFDANLTETAMTDEREMGQFTKMLKQAQQKIKGKLLIKNMQPKTHTVATLVAHINQVEQIFDRPVDVIVIDSGDLLLPKFRLNEHRVNLESIYAELRGLAMAKKIRIINTTQANRAGTTQDQLQLANTSEAYSKAWYCSLFLSINANSEERQNKCGRITVLKNTKGKTDMVIFVKLDLAKMLIKDDLSMQPQTVTEIKNGFKPVRKRENTDVDYNFYLEDT